VTHDIQRCEGCNRPVLWRFTANGKRMPLDPLPLGGYAPGAQVLIGKRHCETATPLLHAGQEMYLAHWATCPVADDFRNRSRVRTGSR
jgi:hypothetical protein